MAFLDNTQSTGCRQAVRQFGRQFGHEYVQNTALDFRNFFSAKTSPDHQNEFGFVLGGPIRKHKTFFFATLDFFRYNVTPGGVTASVPTAMMRQGNFGASIERTLPWGLNVKGEYIGKLTHGEVIPRPSGVLSFFNATSEGTPADQLDPKYLSLGNLLQSSVTSAAAIGAGIQLPYPSFKGSVAQALLPFPQYTYIGQSNNTGGLTEYNAAHVGMQKVFGKDLAFLVDYTPRKCCWPVSSRIGSRMRTNSYRTTTAHRISPLATIMTFPSGAKRSFLVERMEHLNRW